MEYRQTVEVACSFILHYIPGLIEFFLDGLESSLAFSDSEPHFFGKEGFSTVIRCTILLLLCVTLFDRR